ncbi:hypothetical protein D3C86_1927810 [compost metagenome]
MALEQCGCAIGTVGFEIRTVADAQIGGIEKQRQGRQCHVLTVILFCNVSHGASPDGGQRLAEAFQLKELRLTAQCVPVGMVTILLSPARIKARCLQMP